MNDLFREFSVIYDHTNSILRKISENPIVNVVATSGLGKSTILPVELSKPYEKLEDSTGKFEESISNKVVVSVIDEKVSKEYNRKFGKSNLEYISNANLFNKILSEMKNDRCSFKWTNILIIDETDRRSKLQSLIIGLWRHCLIKGNVVPRLVLLSNTKINLNPLTVSYYAIDTHMYPVDIRYHDKSYPSSRINDSTILNDISQIVNDFEENSDIMIFVPDENFGSSLENILNGKKNTNIIQHYINTNNNNKDNNNKDNTDQDNNNENIDNGGEGKIIITDKLGETQSPVDNLGLIIDTMMSHNIEVTITGGRRIKSGFISKEEANLRASRGGKNKECICYRMMTKYKYNRLRNDYASEILKTPIHIIMLELFSNNVYPLDVLWMYSDDILKYTLNLLYELNLIDVNNKITNAGKFVLKMPYGIRQAAILYYYIESSKNKNISGVVQILSMIESIDESYYIYPLPTENMLAAEYEIVLLEHYKKYFAGFAGKSDTDTMINMWNKFIEEIHNNNDHIIVDDNYIMEWCDDNYINYENFNRSINLSKHISSIIGENNNEDRIYNLIDKDFMNINLFPILENIYKDKVLNLDTRSEIVTKYIDNIGNIYTLDDRYTNSHVDKLKPLKIISLISSEIKSNYSSNFNTISVSHSK